MEVIIQSLGFRASDALEAFIREKVNHLNHDKIVRAHVILYQGPSTAPENSYCEIRLEIPGNDPFVKKHSAYFETAVSGCVEVLAETLRRDKEKKFDRRKADAVAIQDAIESAESSLDGTDLEDVVR